MSYTKFGEYIRVLRIKHHEVMGDLAKVLGVSSSFLSSVETGRKNVPSAWKNIIAAHYELNPEELHDLENAINLSATQIKVNLVEAKPSQREAALQFARSFNNMDQATAEKIIQILEGGDD